jgi:hypothetical protein
MKRMNRVKGFHQARRTFFASIALLACMLAGAASANFVVYNDFMLYQSIRIGGVDHNCNAISDLSCAFITITATGDTSTVTPFSVPMASGFTNMLSTATLAVSFADGTSYNADINLGIGGMYVSVDQTNGGAGYSSLAGPTYPLATYGSGFSTYDLKTNFFRSGFGPFCPDLTLCANGSPLFTTDGTEFVITRGLAPAYSSFSSSVADTPISEPATVALLGLGLAGLGFSRRRQ